MENEPKKDDLKKIKSKTTSKKIKKSKTTSKKIKNEDNIKKNKKIRSRFLLNLGQTFPGIGSAL